MTAADSALMVGLATVDLAYLVAGYPAEDSKTTAADQSISAGGPAANAAVAYAVVSGQSPTLLTALGNHPLADLARADLHSHQVAVVDAAHTFAQPPAVSSIVVSRAGRSRTVVSRDSAGVHVSFDEAYANLLEGVGVVLLDGHHPELAVGIAAHARRRGISVVLDCGRHKPVHDQLLPLADVVICSSNFQPPGVSGRSQDDLLAHLYDLGALGAAITNGSDPIRFSTRGGKPADLLVPQVAAVDTLGAGDALHGAFCRYHLAGEPFEVALTRAAAVASETCRHFGPRAWITAQAS